jgi:putative Mn2+ efflux pump MntP
MLRSLTAGFLLGLDSFFVASALGLVGLNKEQKRILVTMFVLCDGVASAISTALASAGMKWFGAVVSPPIFLAVCSYALFVMIAASLLTTNFRGQLNWAVWLLPLLFSIDNLAASADITGTSPLISGVVFGVASALLALAGVAVGSTIARHFPVRYMRFVTVAVLLSTGMR